jgi:response regulator RpfG family c-di-GMP phosphodiesterase
MVLQNKSLLDQKMELEKSYLKLNSSYKNTIMTLSNAVDARDTYTAFHDIGKLGIPDEILHKPGRLTDDEYEIIKAHPQIGVNILKNVDFLKGILPVILYHHEKFSGDGYCRRFS